MKFFSGIVWFCLGILCFLKMEKEYESDRKSGVMLGVFFLTFGVIGILGFLTQSDFLTYTAFLIPIAILCIGAAVNAVRQVLLCETSISAEYMGYIEYSGGKGQRSYSPVFQYYFQGRTHKRQTAESFSKKRIKQNFMEGQKYEIFINSEKPEYCVSERKVSVGFLLVGVLGIVFLGFYFLTILTSI